jgi:biopolymer transport protein ExbB/TolQ
MNCTAFGLLSAIVALTGYSVINNWAQSIEDDIHAQTVRVYNALLKKKH